MKYLLSTLCVLLLLVFTAGDVWAQDEAEGDDSAASSDGSDSDSDLSCDINEFYTGTTPKVVVGQKFEGGPGYLVVCIAEGNCDADGTVNANVLGHGDPNTATGENYGYCSLNTSSGDCYTTNVSAANTNCTSCVMDPCVQKIKDQLSNANIEDPTPLELAGGVDLCNQSGFWEWYGESLSEARKDTSLNEYQRVLEARTRSAFPPGQENNCGGERDPWDAYCAGTGSGLCTPGAETGYSCFKKDQNRRLIGINNALAGIGCATLVGSFNGNTGIGAQVEPYVPEDIKFLSCWSCEVIETVMRTAGILGERVFDAFRSGLRDLVLIVATVLVLYNVGKMLLPFGPMEQGRQMLNRILALVGVTSLVMLLLSSMDFYWKYIYWPVLDGTMLASQMIIDASGGVASIENYEDTRTIERKSDPTADDINIEMAYRMELTVRAINEALSKGASLGWAMISSMYNYTFDSWADMLTGKAVVGMAKQLYLLLSGAALIAVSLYASFVFLYVVIDVALRWTFMSVLAPFGIAAFAFPQTRGFVNFLLRGMMESAVALILVTAVAGISVGLIAEVRIDPTTYNEQGELSGEGNPDFRITSTQDELETYLEEIRDGIAIAPTWNTAAFWHLLTMFMVVGGLMFKMSGVASFLVGSMAAVGVAGTAAALTKGVGAVADAPGRAVNNLVKGVENTILEGKVEMARQDGGGSSGGNSGGGGSK